MPRQKNGCLIKKIVYAKEHGQKPLWILLECSFEIPSKINIFRAGENTLLMYKLLQIVEKEGLK